MKYFVDTGAKNINVFAPVTVQELAKLLMDLGKKFSDYQIQIVFGKSTDNRVPGPIVTE